MAGGRSQRGRAASSLPARTVLPARVHLPSGRIVLLSDQAARASSSDAGDDASRPCLRDLAVLQGEGVVRGAEGERSEVLDFELRDLHVLRALLARAGVVDEPKGQYSCANCEAPFEVAPSSLLEIAPFVDGELDDPDLDAPFSFDASHPIPPIRIAGGTARALRLAPRTARQARLLWEARTDVPLRITPALVSAMGIGALGSERRATAIARALARASDDAWSAVVDLYNDANYPLRLCSVFRCPACSARNDVEAPLARELEREPLPKVAPGNEPFPDLDAFEARVRTVADRVFARHRVRAVDLFIDAGVPACDDGGEPLLGSYVPGGADPGTGIEQAPEIRLFYRSFQSEFQADPSFDWEHEIRETIDHELTHHLHHIAGSDPLDDEERAEIEADEVRRIGRREARRRAGRGFAAEVLGFLRSTWPIWLVVIAGTALAWCADR